MQYKKITDNCTMMRASWSEVLWAVKQLKEKLPNIYRMTGVYPIPRGGCPFAVAISEEYAIPYLSEPVEGCLVVDDDIGTGKTIMPYLQKGYTCAAFACMDVTPEELKNKVVLMTPIQAATGTWLAYPWTSFAGDSLNLLKAARKEGKTLKDYISNKPWLAINERVIAKAEKILGENYSPEALDKAQK